MLRAVGYAEYNVVVHTEAQAAEYRKNPHVDPGKIMVSGAAPGISNQRRWIMERWAKKGEWFATLDDNIAGFCGVRPDLYGRDELAVQAPGFDRTVFDHPLGINTVVQRWQADVKEATRRGAHYIGFATVPNFYFLGRKYRDVGYVISKAALIHNVGVPYDPQILAMDDYGYTAENLVRFGRVLINNWIIPKAGHYEPGGIGTYAQRLPRKIADCEYLMAKYPGLFRYKVKAGCHPKAELQVRFTSVAQVEAWRAGKGA